MNKEMNTLNEVDVEQFLEAARETPYYQIFYLALYTGLRRSELLGLRWKDVDLHLGSLSVMQGMHRLSNQETDFTEPKTAKSRRAVALSPDAVLALREYLEQPMELRNTLGNPVTGDDLMFANVDGSPLSPSTVPTHS